jgi:hypothetical protein
LVIQPQIPGDVASCSAQSGALLGVQASELGLDFVDGHHGRSPWWVVVVWNLEIGPVLGGFKDRSQLFLRKKITRRSG